MKEKRATWSLTYFNISKISVIENFKFSVNRSLSNRQIIEFFVLKENWLLIFLYFMCVNAIIKAIFGVVHEVKFEWREKWFKFRQYTKCKCWKIRILCCVYNLICVMCTEFSIFLKKSISLCAINRYKIKKVWRLNSARINFRIIKKRSKKKQFIKKRMQHKHNPNHKISLALKRRSTS